MLCFRDDVSWRDAHLAFVPVRPSAERYDNMILGWQNHMTASASLRAGRRLTGPGYGRLEGKVPVVTDFR